MSTYEPLKETKDNLEWRINHTTIAKCCYCISTYWNDTQIDHSLNLKYLRPADSSRWNMKENENLLNYDNTTKLCNFFSEKFACRLSWATTVRLSEKDVFVTEI